MKTLLAVAALAVAIAAPVHAGGKGHGYGHAKPHHYTYSRGGGTIVVSCFRGPWKEVIWDRPNAVFVDSLVAVGYTYPTAHAIAERVCRDASLVGNPQGMRSTMRRIYADANSHRNFNY